MQTAFLSNGSIVNANEYSAEKHGHRVLCIDRACKSPVIHVPASENNVAHFKTTGKNDSRHVKGCGFYESLDAVDSIEKLGEYQEDLLGKGIKETLLRINMNRIDPDYESKSVDREKKDQDKKEKEIKVKDENQPPQSISSVKSVVKLLTSYEPDILASVLVSVPGGRKVPLSDVVVNQEKAHQLLWDGELMPTGYFVYGRIKNVSTREKVKYINFEPVNETTFTLVLFQKYWKHFTYSEEQLRGKDVLVFGELRKNDYNDKNQTEMIIKSEKYMDFVRRNEKLKNGTSEETYV